MFFDSEDASDSLLVKREDMESENSSFQIYKDSLDVVRLSENVYLYKTYGKYLKDIGIQPKFMRGKVGTVNVRGVERLVGVEKMNFRSNFDFERHRHIAVLTDDDETALVKEIRERLKKNNPMSNLEIREAARDYGKRNINFRSFENDLPSTTWLLYFKRKYRPLFWGDLFTIELTLTDGKEMESHQLNIKENDVNIPCRFCLKKILPIDGKKIPLHFYTEFEKFTGSQLEVGVKYPKILCLECHDKFAEFLVFLGSIISSQKELKKIINGSNLVLELQDVRVRNPQLRLFDEVEQTYIKTEYVECSAEDEIEVEYLDEVRDEIEGLQAVDSILNQSFNDHDYVNDSNYDQSKDVIEEIVYVEEVEDEEMADNTNVEILLKEMGLEIKSDKQKKPTKINKPNIHPDIERLIEQEKEMKYFCDVCGASMRTKEGVRMHLSAKHFKNENEKLYPCKYCNEVFNSYWKHFDHRHKVHLSGEFECNSCDQVFNDRLKLRRHQLKFHVPKVECQHCHKLFAPSQMGKHQSSAHNTSTCEFCGKIFNSFPALATHIRCVHDNVEQVCDICGSKFANKVKLRSHKIRQHTTERLKCPVASCSYSSPRKLYVKAHLERHKDINQFEKDRLWSEYAKVKGITGLDVEKC